MGGSASLDAAMTFDVAAESTTGSWAAGPRRSPARSRTSPVEPGQRVAGRRVRAGSCDDRARPGSGRTRGRGRPVGAVHRGSRARHPGVDVRLHPRRRSPIPTERSTRARPARRPLHDGSGRRPREMARVTRPDGIVAACVWDFGPVARREPVLARRASSTLPPTTNPAPRRASEATWPAVPGGGVGTRRGDRALAHRSIPQLRRLVGAVHVGCGARRRLCRRSRRGRDVRGSSTACGRRCRQGRLCSRRSHGPPDAHSGTSRPRRHLWRFAAESLGLTCTT